MNQMTPGQQAVREANPDEQSPRLRIDRTDVAVVQNLTELSDHMTQQNKKNGPYRAPEIRYEFADVHAPTIIASLLEHGEVNLWALSRQSSGYPSAGADGFNQAVAAIREIEGVEFIQP